MSILSGIKGAQQGVARARAARAGRDGAPGAVAFVDGHMYCKACGTVAKPATVTPGSIWIEVLLWLCFFVPGLIYTAWRHNKRHDACPRCGSASLIPPDSPLATR